MEAIGAGANVLAFVVLALKSAKVVYETCSAIKDGPEILQQLERDVRQMHSILTWVRQSQTAANDPPLLDHVRQSVQDLQELETAVRKLRLSPSDRLTGRAWKRLRVVLSEKDLARFSIRVGQRAGLLNARIAALTSDVALEIKAGHDGLLQTTQALDVSMQKQFEQQSTRFVQLGDTISTNQETVHQVLQSIEETLKAQESIRAREIASIQATLNELRDHILTSSRNDCSDAAQDDRTPKDTLNEHRGRMINDDRQILADLDRLYALVDGKKCVFDTYEEDDDLAASISDDLQCLLRSIRNHDTPTECVYSDSIPEQALGAMSFESALRRLGGGFVSSTLAINEHVSKRKNPEPGTKMQQSRTFHQKDIEAGKLSLMVSKRRWFIPEDVEDDTDQRKRRWMDHMISLTFLPNNSENGRMLVASLSQRQMFSTGISSISTLMVNRILPEGSRVFQVVQNGDLTELKRMLQDSEASLRDHDEYGASLLMYATQQPQVCKYLISHGLDVDHCAPWIGVKGIPDYDNLLCSLQLEINDGENQNEELCRINQCRKLLLEAGADPTLDLSQGFSAPFLEETCDDANPETIRMVWNPDLIGHFADIRAFKSGHWSPLLARCENFSRGYTEDAFRALLCMGASLHQRDGEGRTCLHTCIIKLNPCGLNSQDCLREFRAVKYLVKSGADPFAKDHDGIAVAEVAYMNMVRHAEELGSYAGDLWDAVMQSCGFEISQFRTKNFRRKARYTQNYTRQDFELLWSGRKVECPYWDDEPWPPLEPGEIDSEDDWTSSEDESDIEDDELDCHEYETDDEDDELKSSGAGSSNESRHSYSSHPVDDLSDNTQLNDSMLLHWEAPQWPPFQHQHLNELGQSNVDNGGSRSQTIVPEMMSWEAGQLPTFSCPTLHDLGQGVEDTSGLLQTSVPWSMSWDTGLGHDNRESDAQEEQHGISWGANRMELENPWTN
ncbi:hypothetical protein B0T10DRAFT_605747 [Thelonectria olida]|uniref:Azaphilone pigments biosynthesis cluster protein L N-terminal domain-containing protein n=1 Tax=Thelonectria olida TaxID=1576542 RepID=A0A9P8W7U5_9HYPO|nr:hypothetical protein B0T10DRAFT_605747 [Thelonectria olida]